MLGTSNFATKLITDIITSSSKRYYKFLSLSLKVTWDLTHNVFPRFMGNWQHIFINIWFSVSD